MKMGDAKENRTVTNVQTHDSELITNKQPLPGNATLVNESQHHQRNFSEVDRDPAPPRPSR